jgi:hypothetical protein
MADQATSAAGRSSIGPDPETPPAGARPAADARAGATDAAHPDTQTLAGDREVDGGQGIPEEPAAPGFGERGRMRRRLRFLRKARELAYRDLGGLVFEMQRLGERHDELAAAKLATLAAIDTELRALEGALADRRPLTVLRESGIAACPRCAAIHGSEDRFCPSCGLPMGRRVDRPIATAAPTSPAGRAVGGAPAGPTPMTAAAPPVASPAPPPPAPQPPPTPPVPVAPAAAGQPSQPATDDRPTEIIRPSDPSPGEGA